MSLVRLVQGAAFAVFAICLAIGPAVAETTLLRIAVQPSITNLPFTIMQHDALVEKAAAKAGLGDVKVTWQVFAGGNEMNDALLSGNIDIAATGLPSFLILWDKGQRSVNVKGLCSYGATGLYLMSRDPNVHTIKDFTDADRIAVPAVKSSAQAIMLQMAVAKLWGDASYQKLDRLTVSRSHPDAMLAMVSDSEINAHFAAPPYAQMEMKRPGIHVVLSSTDVFDHPVSNGIIYATTAFRDANPRLIQAVIDASRESMRIIREQPKESAELYLQATKDNISLDALVAILTEPATVFSEVPSGTLQYAEFMYRIGSIKRHAASWKDMFFPEAQTLAGS